MSTTSGIPFKRKKTRKNTLEFHIMVWIPLLFLLIFNYGPMFGIVIAFKNY